MRVKGLTLGLVSALAGVSVAYAVDVARVNGKIITDKDIQSALGNLNEGQKRKVLGDSNSKKEIVVYDVVDQTASAKLTAMWGIDYMHLAKFDGKWMITDILWQTPPRP